MATRKRAKKKVEEAVFVPPNKQLWIVERQDVLPMPRIWVYADQWFDVRAMSSTVFKTNGEFTHLFISALMTDIQFHKGMDVYEITVDKERGRSIAKLEVP